MLHLLQILILLRAATYVLLLCTKKIIMMLLLEDILLSRLGNILAEKEEKINNMSYMIINC